MHERARPAGVQDGGARIAPPDTVLEIARTLSDAGFEAWCVGGAVRDALLGHSNLDWDIATSARPREVQRLFRKTIPVGVEFGTVGVLDRDGAMHEVTTFRRDVQTDGRHAVVEFGASLDDDLARRDFTINAIAFDPIASRLHDPFAGREDLAAGVVRAVGDADARMVEDRLRALRAIRFASRFGFTLEPSTWEAVCRSAPHLGRLSPERVKQEIEKTLEQVAHPSCAFSLWRDSGAFASVVPALAAVHDATLATVDALPLPGVATRPQRRLLRLVALFSELPGRDVDRALRALRFSNADIATVGALCDAWSRTGGVLTAAMRAARDAGESLPPDGALRRLAAEVGRMRVPSFTRLAGARWSVDAPDIAPRMVRGLHRRLLQIAFRDPLATGDLALDGDDLRAMGVPPGPRMGRILQSLLARVIDDPSLNEHGTLMELARAMASDERGSSNG